MYLRYCLRYLAFIAIGIAFGVPIVFSLLWGFITAPRKFLRLTNWSAMNWPPLMDGLHHKILDVGNGMSLHVVRTSVKGENQDSPFMLFVHGFPEYWGSWKEQMKYFRKEYDVVAVDMRGYGLSSKPQGVDSYSLDKLSEDIAAVIKLEGDGRPAILVGHDWGGAVCWATAAQHPELISKLVIACAPHPYCFSRNFDFDQFFRSWYMFLFQLPFLPELTLSAGDFAFLDEALLKGPAALRRQGALTQEDVDRYKRELSRPGALHASLNYYRSSLRRIAFGRRRGGRFGGSLDVGDQLSRALRNKICCPTLVLWADKDIALGRQLLRGTERYVENLRVKILEDCSHWAQQDRPVEFNEAVQEFLWE